MTIANLAYNGPLDRTVTPRKRDPFEGFGFGNILLGYLNTQSHDALLLDQTASANLPMHREPDLSIWGVIPGERFALIGRGGRGDALGKFGPNAWNSLEGREALTRITKAPAPSASPRAG